MRKWNLPTLIFRWLWYHLSQACGMPRATQGANSLILFHTEKCKMRNVRSLAMPRRQQHPHTQCHWLGSLLLVAWALAALPGPATGSWQQKLWWPEVPANVCSGWVSQLGKWLLHLTVAWGGSEAADPIPMSGSTVSFPDSRQPNSHLSSALWLVF